MGYPGRIAVGVDFSETASKAVAEARDLSARLGSTLELVHIREDRTGRPWEPDDTALAWLREAGLEPEDLITRGGTPWLELARFTWAPGAELLVVGTHGRSGAQPLALGSTAARLVLASPRPVLLVGPRGATGPSGRLREVRPRAQHV